jgi:hypothetical protein
MEIPGQISAEIDRPVVRGFDRCLIAGVCAARINRLAAIGGENLMVDADAWRAITQWHDVSHACDGDLLVNRRRSSIYGAQQTCLKLCEWKSRYIHQLSSPPRCTHTCAGVCVRDVFSSVSAPRTHCFDCPRLNASHYNAELLITR